MKKLASGGPISSHNVQFDQKQFWRFCHEKVISTLNRLKHFYFQWSGCGIVDRAVASTPEDPGSNPAVGNYSKKVSLLLTVTNTKWDLQAYQA